METLGERIERDLMALPESERNRVMIDVAKRLGWVGEGSPDPSHPGAGSRPGPLVYFTILILMLYPVIGGLQLWRALHASTPSRGLMTTTPAHPTVTSRPEARLEITSDPTGAAIWLDGRPLKGPTGTPACTDFVAVGLPPGRHQVELRGSDGTRLWKKGVDLRAWSTALVDVTLDPTHGDVVHRSPCANRVP